MPAARRSLAPLLAALAVTALVAGAVWLAGDRSGTPGGATGSAPVLHIGKPVSYGQDAGTGRYVVTGRLPDGPTTAAVRRVGSGDVSTRVTVLAAALGLGSPTRHGDQWRATRGAAVLVVGTGAGHPWAYSPGGDGCPLPTDPSAVACGPVPVPTSWREVDPAAARAIATKVLSAADPDGCAPCEPLGGSDRGVQVQYVTAPSIGGLPVSGYVSTVVVARSGVVSANGWLGGSVAGPTYPLVTPAAALVQLASGPQPAIGCPAPAPGAQPADTPLVCRQRVEVTGAQLGLSLAWDGRAPLLVPTWFFTVADSAERPQAVAVDPAYLADPPASTSGPGGGSSGSTGTGSVAPGSSGAGGSPVPPDAVTGVPEPATVPPGPVTVAPGPVTVAPGPVTVAPEPAVS